MAHTIVLKRSHQPGKIPTINQLTFGEIAINTHDGKLYIKKDDGTPSIVEIGTGSGEPGPEGPAGPQGERGAPGPTGDRGEQGPMGERGDRGDRGPQGERGDKGDRGDIGPQGERGEPGPKGDTGATGPQGLQGVQGAQGIQGVQGAQGPAGTSDTLLGGDPYFNSVTIYGNIVSGNQVATKDYVDGAISSFEVPAPSTNVLYRAARTANIVYFNESTLDLTYGDAPVVSWSSLKNVSNSSGPTRIAIGKDAGGGGLSNQGSGGSGGYGYGYGYGYGEGSGGYGYGYGYGYGGGEGGYGYGYGYGGYGYGYGGSGSGGSGGQLAIAIGQTAGYTKQGISAIAIGAGAGYTKQGAGAVSLGVGTGYTNQAGNAVAIGLTAGNDTQGTSAVAVGQSAGSKNQQEYAVAIGSSAGYRWQGYHAVAIGDAAGENNQGDKAVAIGYKAGLNDQPARSIVINATGVELNGSGSGLFVAPIRNDIAEYSVYYNPLTKEITYSESSALTSSDELVEGVRNLFFNANRARLSVSAGNGISYNSSTGVISSNINWNDVQNKNGDLGPRQVALGFGAGKNQEIGTIAIGINSGGFLYTDEETGEVLPGGKQQSGSIAIGVIAGGKGQAPNAIAIGSGAGSVQQTGAIAIGAGAGTGNNYITQGAYSIALGQQAGHGQQIGSIAIGYNAGNRGFIPDSDTMDIIGQQDYSIAIGSVPNSPEDYYDYQHANSISLNASGVRMVVEQPGFFVKPIRNLEGPKALFYDPTSGEISYDDASTNISSDPTFTTVTATTLNVGHIEFTGTGPVTIESGNDLNLTAVGSILINGTALNRIATTGSYADLTGAPTRLSDFINDLNLDGGQIVFGGDELGFSNGGSGFDGSYDSLINKPTIPADISDLTDTNGLLGGGGASTGDWGFNGNIAFNSTSFDQGLYFAPGGEGFSYIFVPGNSESANIPLQITNSSPTGRVTVSASNKQWQFDADGNLTLPLGGDIKDSTGTSVLGGVSGFDTVIVDGEPAAIADGTTQFELVAGEGISITAGSNNQITISAASTANPQYGYFAEISNTADSNRVNGEAVAMDSEGNSYVSYSYYSQNDDSDKGGVAKFSNTGTKLWSVDISSQNGDARYPEICSLEYSTLNGEPVLIAFGEYYDNVANKDVAIMYAINPETGDVGVPLLDAEFTSDYGMQLRDGVVGLGVDGNPFAVVVGTTYDQKLTKTLTPLAGSTTDKVYFSWSEVNASGVVNGAELIYNVDGYYGVRMNAVQTTANPAGSTDPSWYGLSLTISSTESGSYVITRVDGWGGAINNWPTPQTLTILGSVLGGADNVQYTATSDAITGYGSLFFLVSSYPDLANVQNGWTVSGPGITGVVTVSNVQNAGGYWRFDVPNGVTVLPGEIYTVSGGGNDMTFDFDNTVFNNDSNNISAAVSNIQGTPISDVYCTAWNGKDWSTEIGNPLSFEYNLNNQAFIARLGSNEWTKNIGATEWDRLLSVAVDSDGNSYAAGYMWNGSRGALVIKYDVDGVKQWAVYIDPATNTGNELTSIDLLASGDVITTDEDGTVTKLNKDDGSIIWQVRADSGPNWDANFRGTATPDGDYIIANHEDNDYTLYVMRVSGSDGSSVWSKRITRTYGGSNGEVTVEDDFNAQFIDCNDTYLTIGANTRPDSGNETGLVISFPIDGQNVDGTYGQFVVSTENLDWTVESTSSITAIVTETPTNITVNEISPSKTDSTFTVNKTNIGGEEETAAEVITWTNPNNNTWRIETYNGGASAQYWSGDDYSGKWFDIANHTSGSGDFRGAIIQYHAFIQNRGTIIGTIHLSNDYTQQQATHTEHMSGDSDLQFVTLWDCNNERGQLFFKMTNNQNWQAMIQWTSTVFYGQENND